MNRRCLFFIPIVLILGIFFFLYRGLNQDPRLLPSTLINHSAPHFELESLLPPQKKYDEKIFLGHNSILNIWASWCETCQEEHAFLMTLHQKYPHLKLIGLNNKDDPKVAKAWLSVHGNPYQLILKDSTGETAIDYGVYGTPESFLINSQGIILAKQVGILNQTIFETHFLPLIRV